MPYRFLSPTLFDIIGAAEFGEHKVRKPPKPDIIKFRTKHVNKVIPVVVFYDIVPIFIEGFSGGFYIRFP